jgi:hypothetical protein
LAGNAGFKGNIVKPPAILGMLDSFCAADNPLLITGERMAKAGWAHLARSLKKDCTAEAHALSLAIDEMRSQSEQLTEWRTWLKAESLRATRTGFQPRCAHAGNGLSTNCCSRWPKACAAQPAVR